MLAARVGNAGLFDGVLEWLEIPDVWAPPRRRARGRGLNAIFSRPSQGALGAGRVLAALESADHAGAKALVEDLLAMPASRRSAGAAPARSPTGSSSRLR